MARSTGDSDDRGKRRSKGHPGYEVLPDDPEEEVEEKPPRKRTRTDEDDHDRPRRRRPRRSRAFPARAILGIACAIAAPLCALTAIVGTIRFITGLLSGNWLGGAGALVGTVIFVVLAKIYGQAALVIWQGRSDEYDFRICGIASCLIGAITALPAGYSAMGLFSGRAPSPGVVIWLVSAIALAGLWIGIGLLSFIEAGVFKTARRRRTR